MTYGDAGDNRVQSSIDTVLSVISNGVKNGRALARQTGDALAELFAGVRAEIIAEFFAKEQNSGHLFSAARELEFRAHARARSDMTALSIEAKSIIGVFADFVGAERTALMSSDFVPPSPNPASPSASAPAAPMSVERALADVPRNGSELANCEVDGDERGSDASPKLL